MRKKPLQYLSPAHQNRGNQFWWTHVLKCKKCRQEWLAYKAVDPTATDKDLERIIAENHK